MSEQQFVSELAARTAQYYLAISDSCQRHDMWAFYEEFEEAMAGVVEDPMCIRYSQSFKLLLNRCLAVPPQRKEEH